MRTGDQSTGLMIVIGLAGCMMLAPGCSTYHEVIDAAISNQWYKHPVTMFGSVLIGGVAAGVIGLWDLLVPEYGGFSDAYYASDYHRRLGYSGGASYFPNTGYRYGPAYHGSGSRSK